jgi:hypothetical protein
MAPEPQFIQQSPLGAADFEYLLGRRVDKPGEPVYGIQAWRQPRVPIAFGEGLDAPVSFIFVPIYETVVEGL